MAWLGFGALASGLGISYIRNFMMTNQNMK